MIKIKIGNTEREEASTQRFELSWIKQTLYGERSMGRNCVLLDIDTSVIHVRLSTESCPSYGASRPPTADEAAILESWRKCHLNEPRFDGDQIYGFLQQVQHWE